MIVTILDLITGSLWPYLAAGFAALAGIAGMYLKGRGDAKRARKLQDMQGYAKTRKAIDDAEIYGDDVNASIRWLRERDSNKP